VYDIIDEGGILAFAMQFIEGRSLSSLIKKGPLPVDSCLRWTGEIADALTLLHREGLVHRDIKPANIMIDGRDVAILTDFGLAKNFKEAGTSGITGTDECIGTPAYMAPEQADDACFVDPRADIYSLGATLYAMVAGRPPYDGATPLEIFAKLIREDPPPLRTVNASVPAPVEELVRGMMARDRDVRFQTPADVVRAVREVRR
ncbi:MAG: serine/threonine-protein kinase, partial [Planctomycetota bacterium]